MVCERDAAVSALRAELSEARDVARGAEAAVAEMFAEAQAAAATAEALSDEVAHLRVRDPEQSTPKKAATLVPCFLPSFLPSFRC
jgi:hypothetical protein